jgi:hypothetical protein
VTAGPGVRPVAGDATDAASVAATAAGADVAVNAYSPQSGPQAGLSQNARALIEGLPQAGVPRVVVVGERSCTRSLRPRCVGTPRGGAGGRRESETRSGACPMPERTARELAQEYFAAWKAKDFDRFRTVIADDISFAGPLGRADGAQACVDGIARSMRRRVRP